jgi:hypothetical protein
MLTVQSQETDAFEKPAGAGAFRDFVGLLLSMHHEASSVAPGPVQQEFGSLSTDHPFWDQVRDTIATYALPFLRKVRTALSSYSARTDEWPRTNCACSGDLQLMVHAGNNLDARTLRSRLQ